ncbi:MAG: 2-phospho-L-lactate transferase [Anaerolineae bacterium]|nr:2-phospho-L-lactate transferase [Anaerolineae bacterium]
MTKQVLVLVGGVGGAKLALGLARQLPPEQLTILVNTGDDFWHYGLRICPDVDTLLYTLSGRVDPVNGWGLAGDSTIMLEALREYGEDTWFRLGDQDLATHVLRTHLLREGHTLTQVIGRLAGAMGVRPAVLPMSDAPVATMVDTLEAGELDFQTYFVRHRWQPTVRGIRYAGAAAATLPAAVAAAIDRAELILIAPSNPWLSIAPILAVPGLRAALLGRAVPRVAITPIVQGRAIKGPAAKMMQELGYSVTPATVAGYYGDVINGFVSDVQDAACRLQGLRTIAFDTIMKTDMDKMRLAQQVLDWIEGWA